MMLFMTRFAFVLSLLSALVSVGCQPETPSNIFQVTEDFNDEQFEQIQDVVNDLCEVSVGKHCFFVTRLEAKNKIKTVSNFTDTHTGQADYEPEDNSLTIRINENRLDILVWTMRHELGHVAGCWRHLPKGNVMYWSLRKKGPAVWTQEDLSCMDNG